MFSFMKYMFLVSRICLFKSICVISNLFVQICFIYSSSWFSISFQLTSQDPIKYQFSLIIRQMYFQNLHFLKQFSYLSIDISARPIIAHGKCTCSVMTNAHTWSFAQEMRCWSILVRNTSFVCDTLALKEEKLLNLKRNN